MRDPGAVGIIVALLGAVLLHLAGMLEWNGPTFGSSPTFRKALWLCGVACFVGAVLIARFVEPAS